MSYELLMLNLSRNASLQAAHFKECIGQHIIAAYLAQHDFAAKVFTGDVLQGRSLILQEIEQHGVSVIGFYAAADNVILVGNLIRWLKQNTSAAVFVGGPESYALGEDFLRGTGCDYIVVGEGEKPVLRLMYYLVDHAGQVEKIESLRYLDQNGNYHAAPLAVPIEDLDALPFPRREDSLLKDFRMGNSIGILTGRGCPFRCGFCFEGASSKIVRYRSIENVMAEIDGVRQYNSDLRHVNVFDDTFTLHKERVFAFCEQMKLRKLTWSCEAHVSCLIQVPDMIARMVDSGLVAMQIGLESGSQRVLDAYQKHVTPEMIIQVVRRCREAGVRSLEGNYIIGGAFESRETLAESLELARRLLEVGRGMLELSTVYLAPYTGTPITKCPQAYGLRLLPERARHVTASMQDAVMEPEALPYQELIRCRQEFDRNLQKAYEQQAILCTKDDILNALQPEQSRNAYSCRWSIAWSRFSYLAEFLLHLTSEEQTYSDEKYPIRTGRDYIVQGDRLEMGGITLNGLTAKAWLWADGRNTTVKLAEKLGTSIAELREIYLDLNYRCLVYFSPF